MLKNFVLETATNPGQGASVALAGAPAGRRGFVASFGNNATCFYVLDDGAQQEWGVGTVAAGAPNTLARTTVLGNSAGTAVRLNFAGAVNVYCDVPAERLPWFDAANTLAMAARRITGLGAGTALTDAAQMRQVGWVDLSRQIVPGSVASASFTVPAGYDRYRLEWAELSAAAAGFFWVRLSFDGGTTFVSSASYAQVLETAVGATFGVATVPATEMRLTGASGGNAPTFGFAEFQALGFHAFLAAAHFLDGTPAHNAHRTGGRLDVNNGQQPTNLVVANSGGNLVAGRLRLLGAAP